MKVNFNEAGVLVISAENNTERVALMDWLNKFYLDPESDAECKSVLTVDYESYKEAATEGRRAE